MKNLLLTISFFIVANITKANDSERFMKAMGVALTEMGQAKGVTALPEQ